MFSISEATSVGFTGTRRGLSTSQSDAILSILRQFPKLLNALHGDCIGADSDFDWLIRKNFRNICPDIRPPTNTSLRAFCENRGASIIHPPQDYLTRNKSIVISSQFLIAAPYEPEAQLRSGTWSTIRYAEKMGKPHVIVYR